MATIGRPPKDPTEKKYKLHIAVDHEVFVFLETLDNKSAFLNKAALILMRARKKVESQRGKKSGDRPKRARAG